MRLNHLNLCVKDLSEARQFFESFFGMQTTGEVANAVVIMNDGEGFTLVLSKPRGNAEDALIYPDGFHVGFFVDTCEEVDRLYHRLKTAHVPLNQEPRKMREGYTFYFHALDGILFEVTCLNESPALS